jgi:glycosyltransferase involved in cell wall biosynthesis
MAKTIILCSRDLDYGVGTQCKRILKTYDEDRGIKKVYFIGPKAAQGYSSKIISHVIPVSGKYFITKEPFFAYHCNEAIKKIVKKDQIDLIILHSPIMAESYGIMTEAVFHGMHRSIIQNYPSLPIYFVASLFHNLYSYFDKRTMHFADKIFFVSNKILNEARTFYPQYQSKFFLKPNEVDSTYFYPLNKSEKQKMKECLDLADSKNNILYVGRLEPFKGILDLIEIINKLNDPNIRLIIIGDGSLAKNVQRYHFVKHLGHLAHEELSKYYNIADIFIFPSKNESYGLALMEAIQCGTKCIAFKPDGKKYLTISDELIKHGKNGFLVKDEQEMEQTIKLLLKPDTIIDANIK